MTKLLLVFITSLFFLDGLYSDVVPETTPTHSKKREEPGVKAERDEGQLEGRDAVGDGHWEPLRATDQPGQGANQPNEGGQSGRVGGQEVEDRSNQLWVDSSGHVDSEREAAGKGDQENRQVEGSDPGRPVNHEQGEQDYGGQVRDQREHQDTLHHEDRAPDVLQQKVDEQDANGHQDTGKQVASQEGGEDTGEMDQDTGNQQAGGEGEGDRKTRGECVGEDCDAPPDPYPAEEDEPNYREHVEGVDLMYSIDPYDKARGFELLQAAAAAGNNRALETLAYAYIFGFYLGRNFTRAFEIFTQLADKGNPIGQQGLGFMYSTGIGVNSNQAKAVVNYVFAALGGHQFAQMAMGYRAQMGVGVVQSCEGALAYYQKSANAVINKATLAYTDITVSKVRLMDEDDESPSIYGVSEDEMLHYQNLFTDSGNIRAQFSLGIYYMMGLAGARRSMEMALEFLKQAANSNFPAAYVLMGKIYAEESEEIEEDFDVAYDCFKAAADLKYGDGFSGLGWLYYYGKGVEKDNLKALELFQKAADRGSPEGHYYLGLMHYNGDGVRRDIGKGIKYLQLASHGDHLHALHLLGTINAEGSGIKRSCNFAVELFKSVSERGMFTRMFSEAHRLYTVGDVDSSFLMYSLLAELGFEEGQSNVAYLLEQGDLTFIDDENEKLKRALLFWNRAAAQGYHQARVKLGDYYYYGMGTEVSYEAAATQYRMASDKLGTPQAMFNLGYMYEHGEGLEKDYHLAKRYYDLAAETSLEAVVPASMALLKLNLVYTMNHYREWLDFQDFLGGKWDIYLITVLAGVVVLLVIWRTRH